MTLRNIGIAVASSGLVGGQLLSALQTRAMVTAVTKTGGNTNPAEIAMASGRATEFIIYGCIVSLVGIALFVTGSVKSKN